jgi:hypothetical protein
VSDAAEGAKRAEVTTLEVVEVVDVVTAGCVMAVNKLQDRQNADETTMINRRFILYISLN